jgi:hypothetical protein
MTGEVTEDVGAWARSRITSGDEHDRSGEKDVGAHNTCRHDEVLIGTGGRG